MKSKPREPEIEWDYIPRIPPGNYPGYTRSAKVYRDGSFQRWVCAVQLDVLTPDLASVIARLAWFLNLGDGDRPKAKRRGNYWCEWLKANGGPPTRKDRMAPNVFTMRHGLFIVGDTTKNHKQVAVSQESAYSVIRGLVRWETGRGQR